MNWLGMSKCKNPRDLCCPQTELDCNPDRFSELRVCSSMEEKSQGSHDQRSAFITETQPREERKDKVSFTTTDQGEYSF